MPTTQQHEPTSESTPSSTFPMYQREIVYDRQSRDYAMFLDKELVGYARTYTEAEVTLDQLVFELMSGQYFREAPARPATPKDAA